MTDRERDLDILRKAREGIGDESRWCRMAYGYGEAHCAIGWVAKAMEEKHPKLQWPAATDAAETFAHEFLAPCIPTRSPARTVGCYNDTHSHRSVVKLFDRAIKRLEAMDE